MNVYSNGKFSEAKFTKIISNNSMKALWVSKLSMDQEDQLEKCEYDYLQTSGLMNSLNNPTSATIQELALMFHSVDQSLKDEK